MSDSKLEAIDDTVKKVGILIERKAPFGLEPHIKYIERDIYQAVYSDIIFAIGTIDWRFGIPNGGTAWAVGAAMILNKPILFFDQKRLGWFKYNTAFDYMWQPLLEEHIIKEFFNGSLIKDFAGIGTRNLNKAGELAIKEVIKWYKNKEDV